jgi:hypothetical protein
LSQNILNCYFHFFCHTLDYSATLFLQLLLFYIPEVKKAQKKPIQEWNSRFLFKISTPGDREALVYFGKYGKEAYEQGHPPAETGPYDPLCTCYGVECGCTGIKTWYRYCSKYYYKAQCMKTAIVIINGIKFPYFLTDRAIAWAKQEQAQLNALFLISGEEMPEEYAFPSDIDQAENLKDVKDAEKASGNILQSQLRLFDTMLKADGLTGKGEVLQAPTLEQVLQKAANADLLFVAPDYGETAQQAVTGFKLQELTDKAACQVEVVKG